MGTDDAGGERAARRARLALVEQMVLCVGHQRKRRVMCHMITRLLIQCLSFLKKIGRTTKWVRKTSIPNLSLPQNIRQLRKCEKLKVYEIVIEKEFQRDPEAIKIGTKWVVTHQGTKTKPMIKAPLVGKEFADDTKKKLAVCRHARASRAAVLGVETCHQHVR